ncbi:hypothetical protein [Romboutsia sp. 1001216sp1]|nr:hypothetical protein [Romboutsia sp. 1001216sp1]MDB8803734.1 hypothetical protein [Romboutsia sp. 1001216sp1]MDB8806916.1 hypothetical protein [Romboutsia sp. 1001216sp1]MDB8809381.1 hypothetical protein [Romboutsia sp. 1001216sp1]MDB8815130.1 hypothetical protein [Romboutsia sp. 1001216sp1]MDB8817823.1 hypothetical protein [Romboutsia sp. 1001216sp1]
MEKIKSNLLGIEIDILNERSGFNTANATKRTKKNDYKESNV